MFSIHPQHPSILRGRTALVAAALLCLFGPHGPRGAAGAWEMAWVQDDWSQGKYQFQNQMDPDIQPGLLVPRNDPADLLYIAEPTDFRGIYALAAYHDTLFLGAGPYPLNPDGAEVLTFDPLTGQFALAFEPEEEGIAVMKVRGDTLYIPGPDTHGSIYGSSVYLYDGHAWTTRQSVMGAVHLFDVEVMDGAIFVSSGDGTGHARIYRSVDQGVTFTPIFTMAYTPEHYVRRMHALAVHDGKLYAQPDGWAPEDDMVFTFDGAQWDTIPVVGLPQGFEGDQHGWQGTFTAWGDSLILGVKDKLFIFHDGQVHRSTMPFWCARMGSGFCIYRGNLYSGAASGWLYRWRPGAGWAQVCPMGLDPETEQAQAFAVCHGRLYVASSRDEGYAGGRLYVSACAIQASLTSLPHDFGAPLQAGFIDWDAHVPADAALRFRLRSAPTEGQLGQRPFTGPDGTTATWFQTSGTILPEVHTGDRWFQYAAEMLSADGYAMPLLRSVRVAGDSTFTGGVADPDPPDPRAEPRPGLTAAVRLELDRPLPNPCNDAVQLSAAHAVPGAALWLRILDLEGRPVRTHTLAADALGRAAWSWNLRDDRGRPLPGGLYQVVISSSGARAARTLLVLPR